ncbi:MAG: acetate--CoA ligase family protein [Candidatus Aminicenantia bacterium]
MLDFLFKPKSVAIIGASSRELTIGYRILRNLINAEFRGKIYPVNPKADYIENFKAYESIMDIPDEVDLAHIVVKNTLVPMVLEECGKKGVKVVIINTAGFSEIGGEGIELEQKIVKIGKKYGVRIFGPNCQGIMNSDDKVRAYCNFTFTRLQPGNISIVAQSGGVGEVINQRLSSLGVGFRMYASNGNACDISIPEILSYWAEEDQTKVIILHIESLTHPREFMEVAKEVTNYKPILGMKTGRTKEGTMAVASHTGHLMKEEIPIELIFEKCGIVNFRQQDELCQAAIAFATQPLPKGRNVAIITNAGGPGVIAADGCIEAGLHLPKLSEKTQQILKENLFPEAIVSNPIDVLASALPEHYGVTINALLQDKNIDSILVNFITPFFVDCEGVARQIAQTNEKAEKPIIGVIMTDKLKWEKTLKIIRRSGVPSYDFAEIAAKVLIAMVNYSEYRNKKEDEIIPFEDVNKSEAKAIMDKAREEKRDFLKAREVYNLLSCYKIPVANWGIEKNLNQCLEVAQNIGYPIVLKIDDESIVHKSEASGVVLNIKNKEELIKEWNSLKSNFEKKGVRYLIQEYLPEGREIIIGAKFVENMGYVIMFGLGGIFVEIIRDVIFKIAPLTKSESLDMIQSIKGYSLLKGVRGKKSIDIEKISEILLRVSQLVTDIPAIRELDLNPYIAYQKGKEGKVVDARIRI